MKIEKTHPVGEDDDTACGEVLGSSGVREDAFEDSGIEVDDTKREVVEPLHLVRLGPRRELLERLELAFALCPESARLGNRRRTKHLRNLLLVLGKKSLSGVFGKGALDHLFDAQCLDAKEVEDHRIGEAELGLELCRLAEEHVGEAWGLRAKCRGSASAPLEEEGRTSGTSLSATMMTVPVLSSPRRPARPDICVLRRGGSGTYLKRQEWRERTTRQAAGRGTSAHRAFSFPRRRRTSQACSLPARSGSESAQRGRGAARTDHGERLGREENLDETSREEQLDDLRCVRQ